MRQRVIWCQKESMQGKIYSIGKVYLVKNASNLEKFQNSKFGKKTGYLVKNKDLEKLKVI